MRFSDIRISVRVSAGYFILLALMFTVIVVGVIRISAIRAEADHILEQDWKTLAAINAVESQSREAATRIVTLIIQNKQADRIDSYARIDKIKLTIDAKLATLETMTSRGAPDETRRMLARIKVARAHYYDSFIAVADLVEAEDRAGAEDKMNKMAVPALDALLGQINALNELQTMQVTASVARAKADINSSLAQMAGLGTLALMFGVYFAISARSITRPLGKAIAIAQRVAHGDLSTVIEVTSKDETGELLQALKDMTASLARQQELQRAVMVAQDATKMKSDFLANMSHEIRTPMNGIIGMTHLALQTDLSTKQRGYLEKVEGAARNLLGIINDILDFSKIEAGKLSFENTEFYLEDVMQQIADLSVLKAQDKGLELLFDIGADVPMELVGDPLRLGQVMINLTNNAIKFTEHGEIVVAVHTLRREDDAVWLRVDVRDTGVGLSMEQRAKLFQAFTQADTSTTRHYGGTGLGLTISKRLVEMMDGEIGVDSAPGAGSTFHFTAKFALPDEPMRQKAADVDMSGLRVLVVDDNASAREIFLGMLAALKFDALAVDSGARAIAAVEQARADGRPFGLVLMDWQMPGMSGVETIVRMREAGPGAPAVPVLLVTAYNRDVLLEEIGDTPVEGILNKPVSTSTLLDTIASVFGKESANCRRVRRQADYRLAGEAVRGAHLLLVEDNEVNQEVAQEILTGAGIRVDIASNGAMAVAKVAVTAYDGVLMDCQMPVMDGFAATRKIRENPANTNLPIIAMTANAMVGDKEKCLGAGMNDFIAKPIDVDQMFATLARWVKPANPAPPVVVQVQADDKLPAIAGLKMAAALQRVGGNVKLMRKLLLRFVETQADAVARITQAIHDNDIARATREAHTVKGLAGNIGASATYDLAAKLEHMLVHGDLAELDAVIADLALELGDLLNRIGVAMDGRPAPVATAAPLALDRAALAVALRELAALLAQDDAEAIKYIEQLCPMLTAAGEGEHSRQIKRLLSQYDFEGALEQLHEAATALNITLDAKEAS
jgi:two-component system, sensor histidine kinase and response regulator